LTIDNSDFVGAVDKWALVIVSITAGPSSSELKFNGLSSVSNAADQFVNGP
jgi:hypothetical protein